jgi:hypothetical protein
MEREDLSLPQDLAGRANILLVTFRQWHQREVNTWVHAVRELDATHPGIRYYELLAIRTQSHPAQGFINSGIRSGCTDRLARERTIALYVDKAAFRQALDMPDEEHIYVLLVDGDGQILWRERGTLTPETLAALKAQLEPLMARA